MAPNNALANPTAARLRAAAEGRPAKSPRRRRASGGSQPDGVRVASSDGFGAGATSMIDRSEVAARGTGTAKRTPLDEFEAAARADGLVASELRSFWTCVMFLTRLPCPGWCDHHPGYLMRSMAHFPLIGALIGAWAAAFYDAAASLWPPLVAAAVSMAGTLWLTGCFHEDGLCDTLDGFGGGWTKSQILKIMRDSRNGSYATMGGCMWVVAKAALLAELGRGAAGAGGASVWAVGGSAGAGPCLVVAQCVARASAAPLIYCYAYVVDDEDAKGEYYNWFGESRRLLGLRRVLVALATAAAVAHALLPAAAANRALLVAAGGTAVAGEYGRSVLGGVMGDFLGATICVLELAIYLALGADTTRADPRPLLRLALVVALPQLYGGWRRWYERRQGIAAPPPQDC
mmetsp:Transcript_49956/g.153678  ORF Transcript_49956/g.153678 Transcript_49956/m.153678 type:complete len:403 (+) Transcript_49956:78-1286(+)